MKKFNAIAAKKRIASWRKSKDFSQEYLGSLIGMNSRSSYNAAESESRPGVFFTIEHLINLKYVLGVSYDNLIEGIDDGVKQKPDDINQSMLEKENEFLKDKIQSQQDLIKQQQDMIELLKGQIEIMRSKK